MPLEAKNIEFCYGLVKALSNSSFCVDEGEVVTMIGPNGAGLLDYYNGKLTSGSISHQGKDITGQSADRLTRLGIAVVPEGRRIFGSMIVAENLEMGGYLLARKSAVTKSIESVLQLFNPLRKLLKRTAGTLSGGEQQMLAIGRALLKRPKLLIADEVSLGLSPNYVEIIFDKMIQINKSGTSSVQM